MRPLTLRSCLRSVDYGWHLLVYQAWLTKPEGVEIVQVKEKFGGLRIYFEPYNEEYAKQIRTLERIAARTCEMCGIRVNKRGWWVSPYGWIKTYCTECGAKKTAAYKEK